MAEIHFQLRAILTAQRGAACKVIAHFSLKRPFASRSLRGIRIKGCQSISMLVGKSRHIIDKHRIAVHRTLTAIGHVLATLHLQQGTHATPGIRPRQHEGIAAMIDIPVVERRVLAFPGIFGQQTVIAFLET